MAMKLGRLLMAGHLPCIYCICTLPFFFQLIVISLASITRRAKPTTRAVNEVGAHSPGKKAERVDPGSWVDVRYNFHFYWLLMNAKLPGIMNTLAHYLL